MEEKTFEEIIKIAQDYNQKRIVWHHHFFPVECNFSKNKKFQIILENEKTKETFVTYSQEKPIRELKKLEELFFK